MGRTHKTIPSLKMKCMGCPIEFCYSPIRGLCPTCYHKLGDLVRANITTWFKLVVAGKCLPSKARRKK